MSDKHSFDPDWAVHPGETLREVLAERGLSQADIARRTGLTEKTISQIVNGLAPVTFETAERLEMALGIAADFWNRHELLYRERLARIESKKRLASDVKWLAEIPVKLLVERGYVEPSKDKGTLLRNVLKFFGTADVQAWKAIWLSSDSPYQIAKKKHPGRVAAWVRMGEIEAGRERALAYDARKFKLAVNEIRQLAGGSAASMSEEIKRRCAEAGVIVVFVPEIPGCDVSGLAKWTKGTPVILMRLKNQKADAGLWSTFLHEANHILQPSKKQIFIDDAQAVATTLTQLAAR